MSQKRTSGRTYSMSALPISGATGHVRFVPCADIAALPNQCPLCPQNSRAAMPAKCCKQDAAEQSEHSESWEIDSSVQICTKPHCICCFHSSIAAVLLLHKTDY